MDRPPIDPAKLLSIWQTWEAGDALPGRTLADLKTAGMPDVLAHLVASGQDVPFIVTEEAD